MKKLITVGLIAFIAVWANQLYAQPDGTLDKTYAPRDGWKGISFPDGGRTMAMQKDGKLLVIGSYDIIPGKHTKKFLFRLNPDGSYDQEFDKNIPVLGGARGTSIAIQETSDGHEKIIVSTNTQLVRLNPDGTVDNSFQPEVAGGIWNLTVQANDKKILISRDASPFIQRLEIDGALDTKFTPKFGGRVFVTLPQDDGKILVGGSFSQFDGKPVGSLVRLNEDGSLDPSFDVSKGGLSLNTHNSYINRVLGLTRQEDGKYLVAGDGFKQYNGVACDKGGFIRINEDGSLDEDFNKGQSGLGGGRKDQNINPGSGCESIFLPDGKIILVGTFASYNGQSSRGIARLNKDGSLDPAFEVGKGFSDVVNINTDMAPFHVIYESDQSIIVAGSFNAYDETPAYTIARLKNTVAANTPSNQIEISRFAPEPDYCKDTRLEVSYVIKGTYNGGNVFTAQISDANGSFSSPVNIGTLNSNVSGSITAVIPSNVASGSKYRMRIVSSDPVVIGEDNGKDFSINTTMPVVNPSASATTICEGQSVTLNGNSGISIGPKTDYIWDNGVENNKAFVPTSIGSKTYTVTGKVGACTKTGQITITVNPLPKITASASPNVVCEGDKTTLKGSGGAKYEWDNGVKDGVAFEATRTLTYTVKGTDDKGCSNEAKVTVTVNPLPKISAKATPDAVCAGGQVTLKADGATTYSWSNGVTDNVPFTPSSSTTYTVKGTDAKGCTNEAKVDVTVNPLPKVTAHATPEVVCAGKQTTLTGGGAATYTWDNNVQDNTPFTPSQTQTYTVIGKDVNNCTGEAEVTITVKDTFEVSIEEAICKGENYSLGSQTLTETGIYREIFIAANGCDSTVILELQVNSPDVSLTVTDNGLSAAEGMDSYQWIDCDNGNQLIQNANGQTYVPEKTGNYAVIVNKDGCRDTSTCYLYQATGVEEVNTIDNNISIYPNPVDGQLNIKTVKLLTHAHISLTNIIGQSKIINPDFSGDSFTIDMSGLANGVYIIEIKENAKVYKSKIVKK